MIHDALKADSNRIIRIIASLSSPREFDSPMIKEADALEIRLDMITEPIDDALHNLRKSFDGPIILTIRSSDEGGAYAGGTEGLWDRLSPYLPDVDMVDLEIRFKDHAERLKNYEKTVIASCHQNYMPDSAELMKLMTTLHVFGDIVKIAVQPQNQEDLLTLLKITSECPYPVIMSVTGTIYRYARPLLCLFGSLYTYCYIESATSPGQYSIKEMQLLSHLLSPGFVDPWFEGRPVRSGDPSIFSRESQQHYR
ncbi:MAG: type I 3-dehydroquinate dehydratase [Methanomicrobiales archaeon]|nr:type I 3-dehydroquinate dehydratase [Methanomicrobiales archaeon]